MEVFKSLLFKKLRGLEAEFSHLSDQVMSNGADGDVKRAMVWVERDRETTKRQIVKVKQGKLIRLKGLSNIMPRRGDARAEHGEPSRLSTTGEQGEQEEVTGNEMHPTFRNLISQGRCEARKQGERGKEGEMSGTPGASEPACAAESPTGGDDRAQVEVVNLSDRPLTESELSLLGKGLSFVPSKRQTIAQLVTELKEWERLMRLREYWDGQQKEPGDGEGDADSQYRFSRWTPHKCAVRYVY